MRLKNAWLITVGATVLYAFLHRPNLSSTSQKLR
nr:MAG TPA: hypothetical protein [Caudoviricetes sp.]